MANDDLTQHVTSTHDFYALLDIQPGASDNEIRRAYRKTALKNHPDKGGSVEKFHLLQIAYDVLSEPTIREQYDNHRRARDAAQARTNLLSAKRSEMKRDLERREQEGTKRKREDEEYERELEKIRQDSKRRRVELEERRRKDALAAEMPDDASTVPAKSTTPLPVSEMQRSIKVRYPVCSATEHYTNDTLSRLFSQFGPIEDIIIRSKAADEKKRKKEKQLHATALLVFKSVVGAHAAVTDFPRLAVRDADTWGVFEFVEWAEGKEPDFVPKHTSPKINEDGATTPVVMTTSAMHDPKGGSSPLDSAAPAKKSAPKFSFKAATARPASESGAPSLDEAMLMRLKNAERRRQEEKIRREEAAEEAAEAVA